MANQSNQNEKTENFKNVRIVRSAVIDTSKRLQSNLSKLRQQLSAINDELAKRESAFKQALEPEKVVDNVKQEEVSTKQLAEQPKVETLEANKPVEEKKEEPKVESKPEPKEKPAPVQPTVKVETRMENGFEVKTYTDEKGNVKVRKFLDTTPKKSPERPTQQRGARPPYQPREQYGQRPARPSNQTFDKDANINQNNHQKPVAKKPSGTGSFAELPKATPQKNYGNKNKTHEKSDESFNHGKKPVITRSYTDDYDEDRVVRRNKNKKSSDKPTVVAPKITNAVVTTKDVSIKVLSEKIGVPVAEIIKQLFKENVFKTINDSVDFDYAEYIAGLYDVTLELKAEKSAEEIITTADVDDGLENDTKRPPIVTVMGHVDHGKTSLLDAIRHTSVTSGEAGGITQHIGAYTVSINGETITFIDTPGHAAFTEMRARGAKVTDVAIIVVAADDGVMPQTIEAINHAKAAGVSIIVAINKMDKQDINVDRVKQQLAEYELLSEDWGGDTIMVPVSAKTGMGITQLLESVLLVTEIKELKANPKKRAVGTVIEARLDNKKGRGVVATVLVSNGTLKIGDSVIAGYTTGKIRAMFDDKGEKVKSAGPSMPVEVLGFSEVPQAGDYVHVADDKLVKKAAEERKEKQKLENFKNQTAVNLNDWFNAHAGDGQHKTLNIIIKTDVQGSLEALRSSLEKISNDEVTVASIHNGVGAINETDVMLAKASSAIIIGFNVRADSNAKSVAEREGVDIRTYNVIYDAVDDVTKAVKGMLEPVFKETILGTVEVREVFKISGVGSVAGGYVVSGKAVRNGKVRVYRNDVSVYDGNILALKRFKDDVKEVASGYECGISVENYNDIKVGDVFEIYTMEEVEQ